MISTIGAYVLSVGLFTAAFNLLHGLIYGKKAPANPWGGTTLEWQTTSPPPQLNFATEPVVTTGPYDHTALRAAAAKEGR